MKKIYIFKGDMDARSYLAQPIFTLKEAIEDATRQEFEVLCNEELPLNTLGTVEQTGNFEIQFIPIDEDLIQYEIMPV